MIKLIIGGTGSGKTSLVNLIPGFYPATEGEILLEGRDIRTMSDEELRGAVHLMEDLSDEEFNAIMDAYNRKKRR